MVKKPAIDIVFCVWLVGAGLSGCQHTADFSDFDSLTIARSGSFELNMTPEAALPLFTAPGEKLWIFHWDPIVLHGDGYEKGTVFITNHHGYTTYWLVTDFDTDTKHAQYVRVTPDVNMGTVDVSLAPSSKTGSIVNVAYQLTALSASGKAILQKSFSQSSYAQMMEDWRTEINRNREKIKEYFSK